ncbi:MAG: ribonuclease E inhibitor RraB [Planctomycetaceae bacterium]|nr:ribonuclease E inhibitor RraB [Planctomycetaceae bacterium]
MSDAHYDKILAKQLAMNRHTWAALVKHGVTEQSELRLDFSYNAPNRDAADSLRALIQEQTDYEVQVESGGGFLHHKWRVEGTTQTTVVSPDILDQWVTWMVAAGRERQCDFDGWGSLV